MSPETSPRSFGNSSPRAPSTLPSASLLTPRLTDAIPHRPTVKQAAFLLLDQREALYGGAAGGGKSEALLMAALQYVDAPGYSALILRRRISDASLPGALLERARQWLDDRAHWKESERTFTFASGAKLSFGYLDHPMDRFRYQSSEFQFIAFDELTQFTEAEYTYLFTRLRKRSDRPVPLRMRAASNPGGVGHEWVRRRFLVEGRASGRIFIPASLDDNPYLDRGAYAANLAELDARTRDQLLHGDWNTQDDGLLSYEDVVACEADSLWPKGRPPAGSRPELYVGVDVGRTRDLTVVWTWERLADVLWCRDLCVLSNAPFREQKEAILARLGPFVVRAAVDQGGVGRQLAEELQAERPGVVEGVVLGRRVQGTLAQRMLVAFRERRVRIPSDPALRTDLRLVRRPRVVGGRNSIETDRNDESHGDRFWAAALGLDAAVAVADAYRDPPAALPRSARPRGP